MIWGSDLRPLDFWTSGPGKNGQAPRLCSGQAVKKSSGLAVILFLLLFQSSFAFSFAVFGDNHNDVNTLSTIFSKIKADKNIAFAVNLGDFVNNGSAADYKQYVDFIDKSGIKVYNVMGNHDAAHGGYKLFAKYFGKDYYSFDHENAHFLVLNNSFKVFFDKTQMDFLLKDLKANQGKPIFVFFHKPTFDPSEVYTNYLASDRKTAEKMMEIFKRYKVRYVMTGHIHAYLRAERDGVIYIVTGGAGGPLHLPASLGGYYHYVKVTVDGDQIKDEVVRLYE
ncbi:MAG: metallophosphoesterase [Candidatus Margulisiibacteriota bacterium]